MPEGHWKAIVEILGFEEPVKASSSKSPCFGKDHTQNIYFVWLLKEDEDTTGRVLCCLDKKTPWSHGETGLKFSNLMCCCYFRVSPPASWDGRNSHVMGSALFSHPHRRNSPVNVFSGNSLKKTGTTPMPPPCTNTRTRRDSIMWPWIKTAHPGRDTGLNDTRNSLTFYQGQ